MRNKQKRIAVIGGGSWATAIAKLLLCNNESILWYMRRKDRIQAFKKYGHNPAYLSSVKFDTNRIKFNTNINQVVREADIIFLAVPSPYLKLHLKKTALFIIRVNIGIGYLYKTLRSNIL